MKNVDNTNFLKLFNPITRTDVKLVTFKNIIDKKKGTLCFEMHDPSKETKNILEFLLKKKNIKILIPSFSRLKCLDFHNQKFFKKKNFFFIKSA